ncbi:unconventional myosin-XVIIIa-like isoform X3 [Haliotis rufescens]|uniref:unconventional myosin-XVIIIa-like isoform X3 n=1 Tax=Haliotis rufescens TaxID=6454 RepID=UPI00201ED8B8|nr:unconventional myosin-XVIIIa-like isoform X3 [Haliotis rufescens]
MSGDLVTISEFSRDDMLDSRQKSRTPSQRSRTNGFDEHELDMEVHSADCHRKQSGNEEEDRSQTPVSCGRNDHSATPSLSGGKPSRKSSSGSSQTDSSPVGKSSEASMRLKGGKTILFENEPEQLKLGCNHCSRLRRSEVFEEEFCSQGPRVRRSESGNDLSYEFSPRARVPSEDFDSPTRNPRKISGADSPSKTNVRRVSSGGSVNMDRSTPQTKNVRRTSSGANVERNSSSKQRVQRSSSSGDRHREYGALHTASRVRRSESGTSINIEQGRPPSRNSDSRPPSRNSDRPPSRVSDRPPSRNMDRPPSRNMDRPPSRNMDRPPSRNMDRPPSRNMDRPPSRNADRPPSRNMERPHSRNSFYRSDSNRSINSDFGGSRSQQSGQEEGLFRRSESNRSINSDYGGNSRSRGYALFGDSASDQSLHKNSSRVRRSTSGSNLHTNLQSSRKKSDGYQRTSVGQNHSPKQPMILRCASRDGSISLDSGNLLQRSPSGYEFESLADAFARRKRELLAAAHKKSITAKSEDEVNTEKAWMDTEKVWLVHKGGFAASHLLKADPGSLPEGKVKVKVESSGDVLEVDEDDVEKANPPQFDRAEDLASLRYLNESSALHTLRQRYAGNLIHTYGGPSLIILNPMQQLPLYSDKVVQMFKGCKQEDMPPHVFSMAQIAYREMLSSRRDQSIITMGRSGGGKTINAKHILHYLTLSAGSIYNILNVDKLTAIMSLMESFGNSRTLLNTNASRYTQITTLDFDHSGQINSASIQVLMFEKNRIVRRPEGEPTFHVFYYMLAGVEAQLRNELQLQVLNEHNLFMTPLQKPDDRQKASLQWGKVIHALQTIGVSDDESKAIFSVLAAIFHLGVAGATKGSNNKSQFNKPAAAQKAASLLGTTVEELARSIFTMSGTSTLTRSTSMRVGPGSEKSGNLSSDSGASPLEHLEAFVVGLYSDVFNAVVSLINRSLSSNVRTQFSITVVDAPGFQNPLTCGRQSGASFEDLCNNYAQERLQLFFHDLSFTQQQDRYAQENIDCDFEFVTNSPAALVSLIDKAPQQGTVRTSTQDLRDAEKKGLLWILDEEAIFPGATEDSFMERFFSQHGEQPVRRDSLLRKGSLGHTFILNHFQGTNPVQYNASGWLKSCRDSPISRNATVVLQDSKKHNMSTLFTSVKAPVAGVVSGSIVGMEGTTSLRRVGSMRRTFMSGTAGLKKKSICLQMKFQVDSVMETIRKTKCHFLHCIVPQHSAGLCELKSSLSNATKPNSHDEILLNVPLVRAQIRGFEIIDAVRLFRQGFPDYMQFSEFRQKFEVLVAPNARPDKDMDEKKAVLQVMDNLDIDKLSYRIGLSQVFFRPGALAQLEVTRDEKITGTVTAFQSFCRGFLGRKYLEKLRVQHLAVNCIQKNVRKYMFIRDWEWWRLYTKVQPLLNVHRTEEELRNAEAELEQMKTKLEKVEKDRADYKLQCDKLENRLSEMTADFMEENTTSHNATELLEAETADRMRLEKDLKDVQSKYNAIKRQNERLEQEVMQSRIWQAQTLEGELDDDADDSIYKERYERLSKELAMTKKRLHQQHEEEMEQELQSRRLLEKRLHDAVEEAEEQRRLVQLTKKKVQRITQEMQDTKLHLEEQMTRNNELERKQRRFDTELNMAQEDVRDEHTLREKLQKERDSLMSEKYTLEQDVQRYKMDYESQVEKNERLEKELTDLLSSGKDNNEVVVLKRAKHTLESKLREQEEELDDQAGQIQQLEQGKLRLEMNLERSRQQHLKDLEEKDEEMEEMRFKTQKKLRQMESQVEEEYEEKRRIMEEKNNLERQMENMGAHAPARDKDTEKRLRKTLKKTKALLKDAGNTLQKQKTVEGAKVQIHQLKNQLDDALFSSQAAVKGKKRMELEIQDLQQQIEDFSRSKQEAEDRCMSLLREKSDLQNKLEENEEDLTEIMKKYKAAVQQQSVDHITLSSQLQQIEELSTERCNLQQEVENLSSRVMSYEDTSVDKHSVTRLENKIRELEGKLDLEQTTRQRIEVQVSRLKEQLEKEKTEKGDMGMSKMQMEESMKRLQKQLRDLREELTDSQKKEFDATNKKQELDNRVEELEVDAIQNQSDLKLAFKRINDLQAALEEDLDSDDSLLSDSDDLDDLSDEDIDSFLASHNQAPLGQRGSRSTSVTSGSHEDALHSPRFNDIDCSEA